MNRTHDSAHQATRVGHWLDRVRRTQRRLVLAIAVAVTCGLAGSGGPLSRVEGTWLGTVGIHDASARGGRGGGGARGGGMRGGGFSRGGMSRPSGGNFQRGYSQGNLRYGGAQRDFGGASSRSFNRSGQRNYGGYGGGDYGGRAMNRDYGAAARDRGIGGASRENGSVSLRDHRVTGPSSGVATWPAGGRESGARGEGGPAGDRAARPTQGDAAKRIQARDRQPEVADRMQDRGEPVDRQGQRQQGREQRQMDRADRQADRQDVRDQRQTDRTDRVTEREDQRTQRREDWQQFRSQTQEQRQQWLENNWDEIEDIYDDHGWWGHYDCYGCMWGMTGLYYGMYLSTIPTYYHVVYVGGVTYRYYDGVYYTAAPTSGYVVAPAPTGAELSRPPPECYVLSVDAIPYCYYQGGFYVYQDTGKYAVVKAPVGAVVPYVPSNTPPALTGAAAPPTAGSTAGGSSAAASALSAGKASAQPKPSGLVEFNGVTYEPVYDGSELAYRVVAS